MFSMSGHKYITNSSSLFEDDDDIDDETFLKNAANANSAAELQQTYEQKRLEIEQRTLASSHRSLGLLHETENVGIATAEELAKQREQLENTNKQLDDINATLRFSQKHLNGLKSVFGGLKNYLSGQKDQMPPPRRVSTQSDNSTMSESKKSSAFAGGGQISPDRMYESHPVARLRGDLDQAVAQKPTSDFNNQLDKNLDEMAGSLSRLKVLAIDLNQEIETQNDLIDDIFVKTETVDDKLKRQNRDMNKLLGKK